MPAGVPVVTVPLKLVAPGGLTRSKLEKRWEEAYYGHGGLRVGLAAACGQGSPAAAAEGPGESAGESRSLPAGAGGPAWDFGLAAAPGPAVTA